MGRSKQRAWLDAYFQCWNATEAARKAGYKHPNTQGPRLKAKLQGEIDARLDEMAMPANEVLARLGKQASGDVGDLLGKGGILDIEEAKERGLTHLIKSITWTKQGLRVELYSSQVALMHLDKYHGGKKGEPLPIKVDVNTIVIREMVDDEGN